MRFLFILLRTAAQAAGAAFAIKYYRASRREQRERQAYEVAKINWPRDEANDFPALASFVGAYLMQDYDLYGDTLKEIAEVAKFDHSRVGTAQLVLDLRRLLLRYGASDSQLAEAFERIFQPELTLEGWDGRTLRESLEDILAVWQDDSNPGHAMRD